MSWLASIFSALLTALLALFVGGFIAALAVDWYHISGREGESGYFVVGIAILSVGAGSSSVWENGTHRSPQWQSPAGGWME
ncbi:MAG TPA: hypothetical protein VFU03_05610 [Gemmatimonadales bacterium]|nr:hypothetical protein [Gemmatimonadales bacterium]